MRSVKRHLKHTVALKNKTKPAGDRRNTLNGVLRQFYSPVASDIESSGIRLMPSGIRALTM